MFKHASNSHHLWVKITIALTVVAIFAASCNLPSSYINYYSNDFVWVTADPYMDVTPTPFLPAPPTPTPQVVLPTSEIPAPTPEGTIAPTTQPTAVQQNITNILLLGSDQRASSDFRTDVIVLVSINQDTGKVSLVSFPRDLYVSIPNWGYDRINVATEFGGFPMMADTFEANFGIRPQYYLMTNFYGFVSAVDSLGGIEINASLNLYDTCKLPQAVGGYCSVGPGIVRLDGQTALWYVRSRYSSSDFDRTRRAQEVLLGFFRGFMSINAISRAPELYQLYQQNVETNLTLADALPLLSVAPGIYANPQNIRQFAIGPAEVYPYSVPETGASVLVPNYDAVYAIVQQAVYGP